MHERNTYFVDGINSMAIHNGVVRIEFMRLETDGKPQSAVQLNVPINSIQSLIDALNKIKINKL